MPVRALLLLVAIAGGSASIFRALYPPPVAQPGETVVIRNRLLATSEQTLEDWEAARSAGDWTTCQNLISGRMVGLPDLARCRVLVARSDRLKVQVEKPERTGWVHPRYVCRPN